MIQNEKIIVKEFNPNPKCKDTRLSGDHIVRAICKVTGLEWKDVYIRLCKRGLRMGVMPTGINVVKREFKDILQQIELEQPYKTVSKFISEHPSGSYILVTKRHAFALVDGIIYDVDEDGDLADKIASRNIYRYFILKENKEEN